MDNRLGPLRSIVSIRTEFLLGIEGKLTAHQHLSVHADEFFDHTGFAKGIIPEFSLNTPLHL
jgi:hypothetical protein